jgi:radical SAM superfamily enzyme
MQSTEHNSKVRCQSCGMPLSEGFYGSNADGSENDDYCKFCYQNGAFTEPDLTLEQMIKKSVDYMRRKDLKLEEEQAEVLANAMIPPLKRWRK